MTIPATQRPQLLEAMKKFDEEERSSKEWAGWEERQNHKYAVVMDGRRYPVKHIISLATGVPVSEFGGGSEANSYVTSLGFTIEAIQLPQESDVQTALQDLLLARAPVAVEPSDAYETLANHFALTGKLRSGNQWESRVQSAREKLATLGVIDHLIRDRWQLLKRTSPKVWVEKTIVKGRPDRNSGEYAFGKALWSPVRAQNGSDVYRNMRFVEPDDIILHLADNFAFTGVSRAASRAKPDFEGVPGTTWGGQLCYRIWLKDFTVLEPPLALEELRSTPETRQELVAIRGRHTNLFYDPNLNLHQGGYLTEAPDELIHLLDHVYLGHSGRHITPSIMEVAMNHSIPAYASSTSMENVWLWSPGDQASRWDEFRTAGIAAIGWDDIGDLTDLESIAAVCQRLGAAYGGEGSKIDARQCYEFAQVMRPGDWIFAKKGRGEIVGFGIIRSGYMHEPARDRFRNVRHVEWVRSGSWPTADERMLAMKAVTRITDNDSLVDELSALLGIEVGQLSSAPRELAPPYTVEDFEEETAIPAETIRLWERRFKRKQHIILQGPPGTGKTYIAERLARLLIGGTAGFCETVQFHPSYSYEDFMQGIRPIVQNEELVFQRMAGRFMRFCEKARHVEDGAPCIMIIDEINRGNLSRVFGELMYLLEYRDKTIPLAGEERLFGIPPNVYIIGTMNTADRSIALVDHALRRRFTFIHLGTDYGVLKKQLAKVGIATDGLVATLRALNNAIGDPNYEIGISPFLKDGAQLTETLKDVWEGEIEPYLEEYFYDQPDKTAAFRWKEVSGRIALGAVG